MTEQDIRRAIHESLVAIAPEADPASLDLDADLREELDLDSMDFLKFLTGLHERLRIDVPEADARELFTLRGAEGYLARRLAG